MGGYSQVPNFRQPLSHVAVPVSGEGGISSIFLKAAIAAMSPAIRSQGQRDGIEENEFILSIDVTPAASTQHHEPTIAPVSLSSETTSSFSSEMSANFPKAAQPGREAAGS